MSIRTRPATPEYRDNFDRIFGPKDNPNDVKPCPEKNHTYAVENERGMIIPNMVWNERKGMMVLRCALCGAE